jgi:PAS domain S-box-containing protein
MATDHPRVLVVATEPTRAAVERTLDGVARVVDGRSGEGGAPDDGADFGPIARVGDGALASADCLVVGHAPPTVDALAVLGAVRERHSALPAVCYPGLGDGSERLAADCLDAGADAYVPRGPDEGDRLAARVAAACQAGRPGRGTGRETETGSGRVRPPIPVADGVGSTADAFLKERALAEAPVGITIAEATPDRPLIYLNGNFEEMTGYSAEEVLGRNCKFLQGADTDEAPIREMRAALDAGEEVEVELLNYRKDGTPFWNRVTIAPVHDVDGELTHFVGFQTDVTKRKEAELALMAEREHLEHLLDRMNGLLGDVTDTLVAAGTREEVERAVCDRVAATDPYSFTWLAASDRAGESFRARAWAGDAVLDAVGTADGGETGAGTARATNDAGAAALSTPDKPASPLREAIDRREVVVRSVAELPEEVVPEPVATFETVAAVPLRYRDTVYGALGVCADGPFDERDADVLAALGRTVATALDALESKRVLTADNVGELELTLIDPSLFFVSVSERADCRLEYAGSVYGTEGGTSLFFTVSGADPEAVVELLAESSDVAAASLLAERDDTGTVEVTPVEESVVGLLAEESARTEAIVAEAGSARLRVTLPAEADAGGLVDRLRERYEGTEFRSYRERTRPAKTKAEYLASVRDRLTERQYAALQKAYIGGYFDRPRPVTGDDLADSMGVTRATFHQHLVAAQRKLLDEFFEQGT